MGVFQDEKKIEIIKKMTRKFQTSGSNGSNGHNDGNFSHFNEYKDENYEGYHGIRFYIVFLSFG